MRPQAGLEDGHVRRIRQHVSVPRIVLRQLIVEFQPDAAVRGAFLGGQHVLRFHRTQIDGKGTREALQHAGRYRCAVFFCQLPARQALLGRRHLRHFGLVRETRLAHLKGCREIQDDFVVLHGRHAAGVETLAVAQILHLENNGVVHIAGAQEVAVQGVRLTIRRYRAAGGEQRLRQHLTAEDPLPTLVAMLAAKEGVVESLQVQMAVKLLQLLIAAGIVLLIHGRPDHACFPVPRRFEM